jgi:hypothetical protein
MVMVQLEEWLPDRANVSTPGLPIVNNLLPTADGYKSVRDLSAVDVTPLESLCRGAFRGRTQVGESFILAGTFDKIWDVVDQDWRDISRVGGYTTNTDMRWNFNVYGDRKFATNGIEPVQTYEFPDVQMQDVNAVADVDGDGCSRANVIAIVSEFVVLGDIVGQNDNAGAIGIQEAGIHWSAIGNPLNWPEVGTDAAINVESDFQVLQGDGGPITDIIPAAEWTAIFRSRQLHRMDYVGAPSFFVFRKMDDQRGATVPGTAVAVGNLVYFLSEEGFMVFNGAQTAPIGHEKIDRSIVGIIDWVLANSRCSVVHDPSTRSIMWSLPVTGGGSMILGYEYDLQRFWNIQKSVEWIVTYLPTSGGNDSLDGAVYGDEDMDAGSLANLNLDFIGAGAANREILSAFATGSHQLSSFGSDTFLGGTIEVGNVEIVDGQRGMLRWIRPVFNESGGGSMSVRVNGRMTPSLELGVFGGRGSKSADINSIGIMPYRRGGRYLRMQFKTSGDIDQFQGFDFNAAPRGYR